MKFSIFDEDYYDDPRYDCPLFNPYTGCECDGKIKCPTSGEKP